MKSYTDKEPKKTLKAIMEVLNEVEAVVYKILKVKDQLGSQEDTVA